MDVFIPEEYVLKRRSERKSAAGARKRNDESGGRVEKEKKIWPPTFGHENEFVVSKEVGENVVFNCLSA
jgi:hypothetical protein